MSDRRDVHIVDCTLREGEQTAGVWFSVAEKLALVDLLCALGIRWLDAGMPAVSDDERTFLRAATGRTAARIGASVRARADEVALALACGCDEVFVICPVSPLHRESRLGLDEAGLLRRIEDVVGAVRRGGRTCNVAVEDASRTELEPLRRAVSAALGAGADRIFLCDTVGAWTPARAAARVAAVAECFPGVPLGVHCHNDLGMATANTVAAVEAGCRWPTVTVNGVGERAGNASLGEVAGACEQLLDLTGGLDLSGLVAISRTVERLTGFVVPQHQPLVGWNAFRHESGIHVDGLMKEARTYESLAPERLGREHHFVVGKHSGRALLVQYAQEHGLPDDAETIEDVLEIVKHRRPDWARESFARVRAALDGYNRSCLGVPAGQLDALFDEVGRSRRCQP